jgi:serine/threonine protein kinase
MDAIILREGPLRRLSTNNTPTNANNNTTSFFSSLFQSAWQKYHATLDDHHNLAFYTSSMGKLKGQVVLTEDTTVSLSDKKSFAFEITTPHTQIIVQAVSDSDRNDWIVAIQREVGKIQEKSERNQRSNKFKQMREKALEKVKSSLPKLTEKGTNVFTVAGQVFEIDKRYTFKDKIGQGAYGIVISAQDELAMNGTMGKVAIKKIKGVFDHSIDGKRVLREVKIMRFLRGHPNICEILDLMRPQEEEFNDLYIVMPLMDTDLHRVIHSTQSLTDAHVQYLLFQLLSAVHFMETAKIVHRDLKPSNILVNSQCELKICDFGLARVLDDSGTDDFATTYVVTRWYRAPELLLSCKDYTSAIDMWAVGCILAELFIRKALFPGQDYFEQINLIINVLGTPQNDSLSFVSEGTALKFLQDLTFKPKIPWAQVPGLKPAASDVAIELLDVLLSFSPYKRISAKDALRHPYLVAYHNQPLREAQGTFGEEDRQLRKFLEDGVRTDQQQQQQQQHQPGQPPLDVKKRKEIKQRALLREAMRQEVALYRGYDGTPMIQSQDDEGNVTEQKQDT